MYDKEKLYELIDEYWKDYTDNYKLDCVVKPSIPVIWFGDIEGYFRSSRKKIITLATNPSDQEFKKKRFSEANSLTVNDRIDEGNNRGKLIDGYNSYFKNDDNYFKRWFDDFEMVLNLLPDAYSASYNKDTTNRAIHIDYATALATDPVWWKLKDAGYKKEKEKLSENVELFYKLLIYLDPDVVLFTGDNKNKTSKFECVKDIFNNNGNELDKLESCYYKQDGREIIAYTFRNAAGDKRLFIYGTNGKLPFVWPKPKFKDFIKDSLDKIFVNYEACCRN